MNATVVAIAVLAGWWLFALTWWAAGRRRRAEHRCLDDYAAAVWRAHGSEWWVRHR